MSLGGVPPHSRIHLPQADMLCPVGAKTLIYVFGLKSHGMSAQGNTPRSLSIQVFDHRMPGRSFDFVRTCLPHNGETIDFFLKVSP